MNRPILRTPAPLLAAGLLALLAGLWAGLIRIGWAWPPLQPRLPSTHGALMISGFLGTLISLERAVALSASTSGGPRRLWAYLAPLMSALGGLALVFGLPDAVGRLLITAGSTALVIVFVRIIRLQPAWYTVMMGAGALAWWAGNLLWLAGQSIYQTTHGWIGFLVLTIAGERLELARILRPRPGARLAFIGSAGAFIIGLLIALIDFGIGTRVSGAGLAALGLWLLANDIAPRTIRQTGLTRFIAACLLPGYLWLIFGGMLWLFGNFTAGLIHDAALHSILLGFVFSMIFGHAPIILPAVLNAPLAYRPAYYVHLALLHVSLILRIAGDLAFSPGLRMWAGLLNAIAILLFLGQVARSMIAAKRGNGLR